MLFLARIRGSALGWSTRMKRAILAGQLIIEKHKRIVQAEDLKGQAHPEDPPAGSNVAWIFKNFSGIYSASGS